VAASRKGFDIDMHIHVHIHICMYIHLLGRGRTRTTRQTCEIKFGARRDFPLSPPYTKAATTT